MSDKILMALLQLFAIVANTAEAGAKGREIVKRFLERQLSSSYVSQYLILFDALLGKLQGRSEEGKSKKRISVNSVKVLRICNDINKELDQKRKIIVLIHLIEFVYSATDSAVTEQHFEFLKMVADTFSISETEYTNCISLISGSVDNFKTQNNSFLIIDNKPHTTWKHHHLRKDNFQGRLIFLYFNESNFFTFLYEGSEQLYLNGKIIQPGFVNVLEQGSVIRNSKTTPVYYNDIIHNFSGHSNFQKILFEVEGLSYKFKNNALGIHNLSFNVFSGNLVGIMGNSGAGKTTLLNLINGSTTPSKGEISINGVDINKNKGLLHGLIGNVPQDDLLIEDLTVYQNLFFSSKLYFGNLNDSQIEKKVNDCLSSLGLFEIKDLKVGDPLNKFISGGQRKRLNIALELIREPEILFVDEPTSGLSSNDAENVMDLLKQFALSGKLIFVVIHQPSSDIFKLFDKLLILDKGGYLIYNGNPVDSLVYFRQRMNYVNYEDSECTECGNINPDEIFKIIESKTVDEFGRATFNRKIQPEEWYNFYNISAYNNKFAENEATKSSFFKPILANRLIQYLVYLQRNIFSKINNRQYVAITLIEAPLLGFILAIALRSHSTGQQYTYGSNPNIPVYIFICTIVTLFLGLIVSAEEIIYDKKILKRESFLHLSRSSYLLSKVSFLFIVSAIQSLLFLLVGNLILKIPGLFADYWLVLFSISCFANLLGLNISSGLKTRVAVYVEAPVPLTTLGQF